MTAPGPPRPNAPSRLTGDARRHGSLGTQRFPELRKCRSTYVTGVRDLALIIAAMSSVRNTFEELAGGVRCEGCRLSVTVTSIESVGNTFAEVSRTRSPKPRRG